MQELLDEIEFLFRQYSTVRRATTQPYQLEIMERSDLVYSYSPEDEIVREPLMEHVGSLPVMATTFYSHIEDDDVDLGRALQMLAIHDIGELKVGDEISFKKTTESPEEERKAAKSLLNPMFHELYDEVEDKETPTAKFAKSIDKITPDILDYLTPVDITIERYRHFLYIEPNEIVSMIVKHKRPYMLWNDFMCEFHDFLTARMDEKIRSASE